MGTSTSDKLTEKRENIFKGTIAVSVIYGCLALGLLVVAYLNNTIKTALQTSLMPFLLTMIIGMIVIIGILLALLFAYHPKVKADPLFLDSDCPDYWVAHRFTGTSKNLMETARFLQASKTNENNIGSITVVAVDPPPKVNDMVIAITRKDATKTTATIEYPERISVKPSTVYTFSAYTRTDLTNSNWERVTASIIGDAKNDVKPSFEFDFSIPTGITTCYITGCQLEEGDAATSFVPFLDAKDREKQVLCLPPQGASVPSSADVSNSTFTDTSGKAMDKLGYSATSTTIPCNHVYPLKYASVDNQLRSEDEEFSTKLRCAFANKCGVSWSAACPNPSV